MSATPGYILAPGIEEAGRITRIADSVIRNLEITYCYHRLSTAFSSRTGPCANWCTFATWASRQAGRTIRAEDLHREFERRLALGAEFLHPVQSLWRVLLRRGLLDPATRLGKVVQEIHSPFDAFERANSAVSRGNCKVFDEIGREFARFVHVCAPDVAPESAEFQNFLKGLRPGPPPEGQDLLRQAFLHYQQQCRAASPKVKAEFVLLANLEIGLHEQTRLQPEIREALEAPLVTAQDLGKRVAEALFPGAAEWREMFRRPVVAVLERLGRSVQRFAVELSRQVVTDSLMALAIPGTVLALGKHLNEPIPEVLRDVESPELISLLEKFEPSAGTPDDCGAKDWAELVERMHYIAHLFRAYHLRPELFETPFTPEQVRCFQSGTVPDGEL